MENYATKVHLSCLVQGDTFLSNETKGCGVYYAYTAVSDAHEVADGEWVVEAQRGSFENNTQPTKRFYSSHFEDGMVSRLVTKENAPKMTHIKIYQASALASNGYVLMYETEIEISDINDICEIFGHYETDPRRGMFRGCPLQTGDLVEVISDGENAVYKFAGNEITDGDLEPFVPAVNLSECIDGKNGIFCVIAQPGKKARMIHFSLDQKTLDYFFGEGFQIVDLPTGVSMMCTEHAFECHQSKVILNRSLKTALGEVFAIVSGPVVFCAVSKTAAGNCVSSLPYIKIQELLREYELPERFYTMNGKLMSVKYHPELANNVGGEGSAE